MATGTRNFIHQKVRVSRLGSRKASFSVLEDVTCFRGRRYSPRNLTESMLRRTTPRPSDAAFSHLQHQGRKLRCHLGSMGESEKIASRFDRIRAGPALSATDRSPPSLVCLCSPTWTSLRSPLHSSYVSPEAEDSIPQRIARLLPGDVLRISRLFGTILCGSNAPKILKQA
jgi:hypothetical protein